MDDSFIPKALLLIQIVIIFLFINRLLRQLFSEYETVSELI